jgi:hypothetical protein
MSASRPDDRYQAYWEAIQRRVCTVCLDQAADGSCGLTHRVCALERHLPGLVGALVAVRSDRMDEYVAAIEAQVCSQCPEQDACGTCGLRGDARCSLYSYLSLVVEAVEEVHGSLTPGQESA